MDCSLQLDSTRVTESRSQALVPIRIDSDLAMLREGEATSGAAGQLRVEAAEAPPLLVEQGKAVERPIAGLGARLRSKPPRLIVSCARGSSAHAATFGKHLFERHLGIPVCAAAAEIGRAHI